MSLTQTASSRAAALVAVSLTLGAANAAAQVPEVSIARQLAIQGIDAVESGDCKKGAPLLERAEQMHHASVHLQYLARCRSAEGHLAIATEMWRQIVREGTPSGASPAIVAAVAEASSSLERALPRLASTTIRVASDYPALSLTLDGTAIPTEIVGAPQTLDPGDHKLEARATGFALWSRRWSVAEGGTAEILITLTAGADDSSPASPEHPPGSPSPNEGASAFPLTTVGWVTASVGAASLVAGTVTLLTRNSRRKELETDCAGRVCKPGYDIGAHTDPIENLTAATNVLMFGGGALLAGGATMILLGLDGGRDRHEEPATALLVGGPAGTPGFTVRGHW